MPKGSLVHSLSSIIKPRIFVVTGATDGIGRHTAKKLASDGHGLIVHGRRPAAGSELVAELTKKGASFVHYLNHDLSELSEVEALASDIHELVDHVDVLINNAGVFDPDPAHTVDGYDMTWMVNVMAPFLLTRRLLPLLVEGDDPDRRIITTSSISQSYSLPPVEELFMRNGPAKSGHTAYSHSKLGDHMITIQLAKILSSQNDNRLNRIKCLTMDPGTVNTKMLLAGWGACGISVNRANNTYKLAATDYGAKQVSGSYHFGGGGGRDCRDRTKLKDLWLALEEHTGCTYDDIDSNL